MTKEKERNATHIEIAEREQTTIRLPKELKEQLQAEAVRRGISFNAYILLLIDTGHRCL